MADQQARKLDEKAEQLHIALIWKYQLGSKKNKTKQNKKQKNKNKNKIKQYKQRRTQTRNW